MNRNRKATWGATQVAYANEHQRNDSTPDQLRSQYYVRASQIKTAIVGAALRGWLPFKLAEALIRCGGLRNA